MSETYSLEEVGKHTSPDDLWIIIHNKVYNISTYLEEHPGGIEVLKECAGADATFAFEDVGHSDDAVERLADFLVGELADEHRQENVEFYRPTYEKVTAVPILKTKTSIWKRLERLAVKLLAAGALGTGIYLARNGFGQGFSALQIDGLKQWIPHGLPRPAGGFWQGYISSTLASAVVVFAGGNYLYKSLNEVHDFQKFPAHKRSDYTILVKKSTRALKGASAAPPVLDPRTYRKFPLAVKEKLSPNTYHFVFDLPTKSSVLGLPIGQHVAIRADIGGQSISRSYTPVSNDTDKGVLEMVIKVYPNGLLTNYLASLNVGDKVEFRGPKGAMKYHKGLCKHIGMIAGGTGITPMYQLIRAICEDESDNTTVSLLYANNTEEDILLRARLDAWAKKYPKKFKVWYVLSQAPTGWQFGTGFVTKDLIKERLPTPSPDSKIMLCGPPGMINAMKTNLDQLGFTTPGAISTASDQIFLF
ncbi:MAG: hypothetical protein M1819_004557 [Sarea resinae]|nr:MAG: hypothetical protein M1819_004557 [Sarea resinae]